MPTRNICLIGGTGFVGHHLAAELSRRGQAIKVLTRRRERNRELLVFPRLELVQANVHYVSDLAAALEGCDAVVNLTGILNETGNSTFQLVHDDLPGKIIEACRYQRIKRILHVSALGAAEDAPSAYLRSKWAGEQKLRAVGSEIGITIFRPSVIFGPDDSFFNRFAGLLRIIPLVFPLACPGARFQPVYVGDVVQAICVALEKRSTYGQAYDLCGPHTYTLRELVEYTMRVTGIRRRIWPLSQEMAERQARLLERVPGKPLSRDNLRSLSVDSVSDSNGLQELGISPTGIDAVVPRYLGPQGNRRSYYQSLRRLAGR